MEIGAALQYSPVTKDFSALSPAALKGFFTCFIDNLPYCLDSLIQAVWKTPGFESWAADFSADSLLGLGEWFASQVGKVDLTDDQLSAIKASGNVYLSGLTWQLADKTLALAVQVGMYCGQVAINENPHLRWEQAKGGRKNADYGQPVVAGGEALPYNPVRVANVFASGIADGSKTPAKLKEGYEYWKTLRIRSR